MRADCPYYVMSWTPQEIGNDVTYKLLITPTAEGWAVEASGSKFFQDDRYGDFAEDFEIDHIWYVNTGDNLEDAVDDLLAELSSYSGPEEPTPQEPDVDDIDENKPEDKAQNPPVDSVSDEDIDTLLGWHPVKLLSAPEIRHIFREAGFRVKSLYRSKVHHGWTVYLIPVRGKALDRFNELPHHVDKFAEEVMRQGIKQRFPGTNSDDRFYISAFNASDITAGDPASCVVVVLTKPSDFHNYVTGGIKLIEADETGDVDPAVYVDRLRTANMGDIVKIKCPACGETKLLAKNWPAEGMATRCDKCHTRISLGGEIVAEDRTDTSLNSDEFFTQQGWQRHTVCRSVPEVCASMCSTLRKACGALFHSKR